ncbi:MAG: hypothetical protein ABIM42_05865 [candidate division WOR-3 bacterium]
MINTMHSREEELSSITVKSALKAVRPIFPSTYDALLVSINAKKRAHYILSEAYRRYKLPSILVEMLRHKWGEEPVDYSCDSVFSALNHASSASLLSLLIAERCILAHKRKLLKHLTVAVVGLKGSGKTTYSIASAAGALMLSNLFSLSEQDIINALSELIFFEPESFISLVRYQLLEKSKWVPVIILDDVGAQISKYWIHIGEKYWSHLFSVLDHLKDWCGVLILTATSFSAIPSRLRDIVDVVIEASETDVDGYIIDEFIFYRRDKYLPDARKKPMYIDVAPPTLKMPDEIWKKMRDARKKMGQKRLDKVISELRKTHRKPSRTES